MMKNKEDKAFLKYIQGVDPIKKQHRIKKAIKKIPKKFIKKILKIKKLEPIKKEKNDNIKKSQFSIEEGKTKKMLNKGQISIDRNIDFHGKTLFQAEDEFQKTILESYEQKKRCLLFVTGKGLRNQNRFTDDLNKSPKLFYGKIREAFLEWVKKPELSKYVLSIEKAKIEHGGDGAFYVYLRKNKN